MEQLNSLEISILKIIEGHQGRECAISREQLVLQLNDENPLFPVSERTMRETIKHLVTQHGVGICSWAKGYFMAETAEELNKACAYYHGYAMSLLHVEAKLRKMSLAELLGQLRLEL